MATNIRVTAQIGTEPKFIAGDSSGNIVGLCIDIMRAIEHVDPNLKFVGDQRWMPLTRASVELSEGKQDAMCALQRTAERDKKFLYLEPALYPVEYVLLARIDDPIVINNWDDVRSLIPKPTILVNRGFGVNATLLELEGIQVDASSSETKLNIEKLVAGRARLYFHRGPGVMHILERAGVARKVRVLPVVMKYTEFYFVVGRHLDKATVMRIQQSLVVLKQSGELNRLYDKWN